MNVYQIKLACSNCESSNELILTDKHRSADCENCGEPLLTFRRFDGCVYVLKNSKVDGVKIGMTSGDVFSRAKQISGTGVPGNFQVVAAFHSRNPRKDEKKIHTKLVRYNIEKEHFGLDPVTSVVKIKTILGREWIYLKPQYVDQVAALVQEQRSAAAARFAGSGKTREQKMDQQDLFAEPVSSSKATEQKSQRASRGGVFSFLFD